MATYNMGFLGPFHGKLGTAVGATVRGVSYMRSLPKQVRNPRTPAQVQVRANLRLASRMASWMRPLADLAHSPHSVRMGAQAYCVRQLLGPAGLKADPGTGKRTDLTAAALDITQGRGPALKDAQGKIEAGQLKVQWTAQAGSQRTVSIALVGSDGKLGISQIGVANEADGTLALPLPAEIAALEVPLLVVMAYDGATRKASPTVAVVLS